MSLLSFAASCRPALRLSWRVLSVLVLVLSSLALAAWLTLHWGILPRLDDWRGRIESAASRAVGVPVQIGRIEAHSSSWVPAFTLSDVVLRDSAGREALRLPRVHAALSVPRLLALQVGFEQLLIEGARLEVRRDARGQITVAGLDLDAGGPALDGQAATDWFFEQREFVIRGGELRWVDEQRAAPPLALADVALVVRNRGRRHELRLDATPPADWGQRFSLVVQARQPLLDRSDPVGGLVGGLGRTADWRRWRGTLYADLPEADVARLRRHVDLPVDLQQGRAALRAWIDWDQGLPRSLTVDAALADVSVQLAPALQPLVVSTLSGRFVASRDDSGARAEVSGLQFTLADGTRWEPSRLAFAWRQAHLLQPPLQPASAAAPAPSTGGSFSADRLDLAPLAALAEHLPLGASLRRLLAELAPEGTVRQLDASWRGPLDAPSGWTAKARLSGLAIAAAESPEPGGIGRPGWRGADLEITAGEAGGQAKLAIADGELVFPGVFEQARVPLSRFSAGLSWKVLPAPGVAAAAAAASGAVAEPAPPRLELTVDNARFANDDLQGEARASWRTGAGAGFGVGGRLPGVLTLDGRLARGKATAVARYLPLGVGADSRHWVQHAVQAGEVRDVSFRVKGDLWNFPFVNQREGEFRIAGQVRDALLATVPSEPNWISPWPAFANVSGQLVFERNSMQFSRASGRLWGVELAEVSGRIRDLSEQAVLEIDGTARGPASDLLRYVNTTPVGQWTGGALAAAQASGTAELKLALNVPLSHSDDTVLRGSVLLAGNDVRLGGGVPPLGQARGRIDFTHRGLQLAGVQVQALGGEATLDGGSQADGSLRFTAGGTASIEALRRSSELGAAARWLAQAGPRVQGSAAYRLQLGLVRGQTEFSLSSNLQGVAIDLPAPLKKAAGEALALKIASTLQAEPRGAAATRDWLRIEAGALQGAWLRELSGDSPQVLRSAIAWGAPLPEAVAGGRAVLQLPALDVDAWRRVLDGLSGGSSAGGLDATLLPQSIRLQTAELQAQGRRLTGLVLDLQRLGGGSGNGGSDEGWRAQLQSDQAAGSIEYRDPRAGANAGRLRARLTRLTLPPAEAERVEGLLDEVPATVPALDIDIDSFELRGRALGRLSLEAVNRAAAAGRNEWRLQKLELAHADAKLAASGSWQPALAGQRRRMALEFKLDVADGGKLLERLGFGRVVRGAKGTLAGNLAWDGSPLALDFPTLTGGFAVNLGGGQFLKADAGAGRLLGVLSLQALPRRLVLDFRDVFAEGFGFDDVTGDVAIARGVASSTNLRMRGLQAAVLMEGQADIARATQDLHVVVLPELNTASATLAYAAINPAVGLGAFLGQWLLREPLRQASMREFRISGSWDDPQVERLDSVPAAATAAAAAAASAASR